MSTKDQIIISLANESRYELGLDDSTAFKLAELEYEDVKRKGCLCETAQCYECRMFAKCPMLDWEKRHPKYAKDELSMKIRALCRKAAD